MRADATQSGISQNLSSHARAGALLLSEKPDRFPEWSLKCVPTNSAHCAPLRVGIRYDVIPNMASTFSAVWWSLEGQRVRPPSRHRSVTGLIAENCPRPHRGSTALCAQMLGDLGADESCLATRASRILSSRRRNSTPENGNRTLVPARCPYSVPSPSRAANLARLKWRTCLAGLKRRAALLTFRLIKRRLKNSGRLPQVSGPLSFQRRQSPLRRLLRRRVSVLGRC
ncbi:hypothetical protein GA0061101_111110 [Rhizobium lusitanum]|uniref:Uncharacterized protein n=1 Tax=Rhizobium lusitanum TaxID=293958 RepID=A0A1C3WGH9_9HYPH|nr:hypothetical protein GA0061101_111110 [Rhizobium lusitanum]